MAGQPNEYGHFTSYIGRLLSWRDADGGRLSMRSLERMTGVGGGTLSRMLAGERTPSYELVCEIGLALTDAGKADAHRYALESHTQDVGIAVVLVAEQQALSLHEASRRSRAAHARYELASVEASSPSSPGGEAHTLEELRALYIIKHEAVLAAEAERDAIGRVMSRAEKVSA